MIERQENKRDNVQIVCLSELVPNNHLLKKIDKVMDFNFVYELVEDKYSKDTGRPSIDPVVLVKMVLMLHRLGSCCLPRFLFGVLKKPSNDG